MSDRERPWERCASRAAIASMALAGLVVSAPAGAQEAASWVAGSGGLPAGALAAGSEGGQPVYACRPSGGGPAGKLAGGVCVLPQDGEAVQLPAYDVLVAEPWDLKWTSSSQAAAVPGALCQVDHLGNVIPGYVRGERCHFVMDGKETMAVDFTQALPNETGDYSMLHAAVGRVPAGTIRTANTAPAEDAIPICLAQRGAQWLPGGIVGAQCVFVDQGRIATATDYTVIIGNPARVAWVPYQEGELERWEQPPANSVKIGGFRAGGAPIEICRIRAPQGHVPGQVAEGLCVIPVSGQQVAGAAEYEVLHYIRGPMQQSAERQ